MNLEQQHQWDAWARAHITNYLATVGVGWISSLLEHERKHMAEHVGAVLGKFRAEHDMRLREIEAQLRETQRQLDQLCGNPTDKVEIVDLPPGRGGASRMSGATTDNVRGPMIYRTTLSRILGGRRGRHLPGIPRDRPAPGSPPAC